VPGTAVPRRAVGRTPVPGTAAGRVPRVEPGCQAPSFPNLGYAERSMASYPPNGHGVQANPRCQAPQSTVAGGCETGSAGLLSGGAEGKPWCQAPQSTVAGGRETDCAGLPARAWGNVGAVGCRAVNGMRYWSTGRACQRGRATRPSITTTRPSRSREITASPSVGTSPAATARSVLARRWRNEPSKRDCLRSGS
jgi:hypothetical protein